MVYINFEHVINSFCGGETSLIPGGGVNNIKNITDRLKVIQAEAKTKVQGGATHVLRHTCASLYFRQGVQVEIIASILGNSADVCRTTYVHFIEEQQRQASDSISRIDIE